MLQLALSDDSVSLALPHNMARVLARVVFDLLL